VVRIERVYVRELTMSVNIRRLGAVGLLLTLAIVLEHRDNVRAAPGSTGRRMVVVELFTSEGCSSCPPADDVLSQLAGRQPVPGAEVLALGEHVDYWDRLGWRDPFASAEFSARQSNYDARVFHTNEVYTPQLVIDGRFERVGSNARAVQQAIEQAAMSLKATIAMAAIRDDERDVRVQLHVDKPADLSISGDVDALVAVTEDNLSTDVRRGENRGRTLTHSGVVRSLTTIGTWRPSSAAWSVNASVPWNPTWKATNVRVIAFLQERDTGRIVGAGSVSLDQRAGTP
jgi:hypothetical protein